MTIFKGTVTDVWYSRPSDDTVSTVIALEYPIKPFEVRALGQDGSVERVSTCDKGWAQYTVDGRHAVRIGQTLKIEIE